MIPTLANVYAGVRAAIGDTEVPQGQVWTDTKLQEHVSVAYRLLYQYLSLHDEKQLRRPAFFNLPAYQTYLSPDQLGITNLGEPKNVYERTVGQEIVVTGATPTPASFYCDLTVASHAVANGDSVLVYGVGGLSDDVNTEWGVTVAPTAIRLLGCKATGTWTSGGTITTSTEPWPIQPMTPWRDPQGFTAAATLSGVLGHWAWSNGAFRFPSSSLKRQLMIVYELSGTMPTAPGASMGVDDCANFLVEYATARALAAKGAVGAEAHFVRATGNAAGEPGAGGEGMLGQLVKRSVKTQQKVQRTVLQRYRPKRNTGPYNWY